MQLLEFGLKNLGTINSLIGTYGTIKKTFGIDGNTIMNFLNRRPNPYHPYYNPYQQNPHNPYSYLQTPHNPYPYQQNPHHYNYYNNPYQNNYNSNPNYNFNHNPYIKYDPRLDNIQSNQNPIGNLFKNFFR